MSYYSWEKRPPRKFRGKPQWTLDEVYISPFTARRRYDEEGVMHYDEVERRLHPTGVEVMDHNLRRLTEGKDEVMSFCKIYGLRTEDLDALIFILTGMSGPDFRMAYQLRLADDLLRYTDPAMTATVTVDCTVQATDLSCTVLSNRIRDARNMVIAKVTNCSPLPMLAGQSVTVGLYASAADTEPIEGTTLVTIPASDLHAGGKPLSKVVRLQANDLADNMQAVIKVVVADGENNVVTDVRPENNFVPVSLYSEDGSLVTIPGDVNRDGAVDSGDIMAVYSVMAGNGDAGLRSRADVNGDGAVDSGDIMTVYGIMAGN